MNAKEVAESLVEQAVESAKDYLATFYAPGKWDPKKEERTGDITIIDVFGDGLITLSHGKATDARVHERRVDQVDSRSTCPTYLHGNMQRLHVEELSQRLIQSAFEDAFDHLRESDEIMTPAVQSNSRGDLCIVDLLGNSVIELGSVNCNVQENELQNEIILDSTSVEELEVMAEELARQILIHTLAYFIVEDTCSRGLQIVESWKTDK